MDSALTTVALPLALGIIMFGLGLSLGVDDFRRVARDPKVVVMALGCQLLLLPLVCFGVVTVFDLDPLLAVGLMLLAASPGGISANLFSHLFGGNVAMNISLTAINTLLSIVTMPLIANWAINTFAKTGQVVPLQFGKVAEVIAVVLVPVVIGMVVAARKPAFSARMEKPFKIFSALVLAAFAAIAIAKEWEAVRSSFTTVGPAVVLFNLVSLLAGYYLSRAAGMDKPMATAISFEIGIHNSTLALFIALSVLNNFQLALPSAIYSVAMYVTATLFGLFILRPPRRQGPQTVFR